MLSDGSTKLNWYITHLYNALLNLAASLTQWLSIRIALQKRRAHVTTFNGPRPISLVQSAKMVFGQLGMLRTKHHYRAVLQPNQAAYVENCSCELLVHALQMAIFRASRRYGQEYVNSNDAHAMQAFDRAI